MRTNVPGGIEVVAVTSDGERRSAGRLAHGQHVEHLLLANGLRPERPCGATMVGDSGVVIEYLVHPDPAARAPEPGPLRRDADVGEDELAEPYQRLGVYAVIEHDGALLLTQFNDRTGIPGRWGLPGGGLDEGENPQAGVVREVWEETGQHVVLGEVIEVQSQHWVGRPPDGPPEDYHAVRIVWRATCPAPVEIVIHDVGGTTAAARWVPLGELDEVDMTASWRHLSTLSTRGRGQAGR